MKKNILKISDFVATRINWKNKSENIISISKELNLGLDSFVFVDDNPTERANVTLSNTFTIDPYGNITL